MSTNEDAGFGWGVPDELGIPKDTLRLRLDFYHQACIMTVYEDMRTFVKPVDALDVAHALASELSYSTGMLPEHTLWWENTRSGPVTAVYDPPAVRKLAVQHQVDTPPARYTVPLPGFVFLCTPNRPPWVYAVKSRPKVMSDPVFKAPLLNVYNNGSTCPGNQKYPEAAAEIINTFWISFFSHEVDTEARSVKFDKDIERMWQHLNGKQQYPLGDLMPHGTVHDLMAMALKI